jgi:malate dehydrogenase (oxaloacetate-decarboxylating)(NADP+)
VPDDDVEAFLAGFVAAIEGQHDVASVLVERLVADQETATPIALTTAAAFAEKDPIFPDGDARDLGRLLREKAAAKDHKLYFPRLWLLGEKAEKSAPEAARDVRAMVDEFPEVPEIPRFLATIYGRLGWRAERTQVIKALLERFPEDRSALESSIAVSEEGGKIKEADELAKRLVATHPDSEIELDRAIARHDYTAALAELKRLGERRPDRRDIAERIAKFGLRLREGEHYALVNVEDDHRYRDFWQTYHRMAERKGVTVPVAKIEMRRRLTLIGSMLLHKGDVDGLICGTWGTTALHLNYIDQVIGPRHSGPAGSTQDVPIYACMNGLMLPGRQVFLVDTHVNYDPTARELARITVMAAEEMLRFGITPKAALMSHSNFGSSNEPSAVKMRETLRILEHDAPWLEVDGEMHGDLALDGHARAAMMPNSNLQGDANLLVMPNIDAANIAYNLLKTAAGGNIAIGPVLLGAAKPVHVLTASTTVRRIVNMTALTVADANATR